MTALNLNEWMNKRFNIHQPAFNYRVLFAAAIVFIITAYNSDGYYGTDEQFHIIEFAKIKLGLNQVSDMPWGYNERFRSSVQPVICLLVFKFAGILHISDPYTFAFLLRLLSACLALGIIYHFICHTQHLVSAKNARIAYHLLSYFLWFIPFLSVRFSAETWGGLFFLFTLTLYFSLKQQSKRYFLIGCALGLSFLFRFQMIFAAVGFVLYLMIVDKLSLKAIGSLIAGSCIVLLAGNMLDCWFYGTPVFTLWNYFYAFFDNTIHEDSAGFGTSPWYTYLEQLLRDPGYFLGVTLILAIIVLIVKQPKNIFLWSFLSFFIIHSCIGHKEERFIFPVIYLFPVMLILAYEMTVSYLRGAVLSIFNYLLVSILLLLNFIGLFFLGICFAGNGKIVITKYIHDHYSEKPIHIVQSSWHDVYDKHGNIIPYKEKTMDQVVIGNLCDLTDSILIPGKENLLIIQKRSLELKSCASAISEHHFVLKKQSVPTWFEWINNNFYYGFDGLDIYMVYRKE